MSDIQLYQISLGIMATALAICLWGWITTMNIAREALRRADGLPDASKPMHTWTHRTTTKTYKDKP